MKATNTTKFTKAIVKSIISINLIQLIGDEDPKTGALREIRLILWGLKTPSLGESAATEEPLAFEGKEYMRRLLVGKEVEFIVDLKDEAKNIRIGRIVLDKKDIALEILAQGFATPKGFDEKGDKFKPLNLEEYRSAAATAEQKKIGLYKDVKFQSKRANYLKHKDNSEFPSSKYLTANKDKLLDGYIDDLFNTYFILYVSNNETSIKARFANIYIPNVPEKPAQLCKNYLTKEFVQRDFQFVLKNYDEKYDVFLVSTENVIIEELVVRGLAKIDSSAVINLTSANFNRLKELQIKAQDQRLGFWANEDEATFTQSRIKDKARASLASNEIYDATVLEVHSGDSLTVVPEGKTINSAIRLFLASIRAPAMGNLRKGELNKPWAFEARELLRKACVGKKVKVEIEFTKKINVKIVEDEEGKNTTEEKSLTFASILLNDVNLGEMIVEKGLANVQIPKGEDNFSKYLKQLNEKEQLAKTSKVGVHSPKQQIVHRYVDLSMPEMHGKARQNYDLLKAEKKLKGVVEAVISGCRFKILAEKGNCYIVVGLSGVRCLKNDKNLPDHSLYSEKALAYAKLNFLNRDIELEIENIDKRGTFYGYVYHNKKSFGELLLDNGLAYTSFVGKEASLYKSLYIDLEQRAKKLKLEMWSKNIVFDRGEDNFLSQAQTTVLNEKRNAIVSEIIDGNCFYLQHPDDPTLNEISKKIDIALDKAEPLQKPVSIGTPCIAEFEGDWYRGKVTHLRKDDTYEVLFTDYGNSDILRYSQIKKIPKDILDKPIQARQCKLAYIETPDADSEAGEISLSDLKKLIWNLKLTAHYIGVANNVYNVILHSQGKSEIENSFNHAMIKNGSARIDPNCQIPEEVKVALQKVEAVAKNKGEGIWYQGSPFKDLDA